MTLKPDIRRELDRIQAVSGRGLIAIDLTSGRLEADIVAADAIGCAFQTLSIQTDRLAGATIEQLRKVSEALAARLHYLLEPIGLVETDSERCAIQLRSNPPQKADDGTHYYELLVRRGGDISLSRYAKRPGQIRQIVPANVTREVFERLADDFVAVIS
jgi:hypothetical protein